MVSLSTNPSYKTIPLEKIRHCISAFQAAMSDMEDRMDGGHSEVLDKVPECE